MQADFDIPTPNDIDAQIRAAHRMRAETVARLVKSAARWLAHPRTSAHTA